MSIVLPRIDAHAFKKDVASTANRRPCAAIQVCVFITMQLCGVRLIELCYYNNSATIVGWTIASSHATIVYA